MMLDYMLRIECRVFMLEIEISLNVIFNSVDKGWERLELGW